MSLHTLPRDVMPEQTIQVACASPQARRMRAGAPRLAGERSEHVWPDGLCSGAALCLTRGRPPAYDGLGGGALHVGCPAS
jgi:hypothetical protein